MPLRFFEDVNLNLPAATSTRITGNFTSKNKSERQQCVRFRNWQTVLQYISSRTHTHTVVLQSTQKYLVNTFSSFLSYLHENRLFLSLKQKDC